MLLYIEDVLLLLGVCFLPLALSGLKYLCVPNTPGLCPSTDSGQALGFALLALQAMLSSAL